MAQTGKKWYVLRAVSGKEGQAMSIKIVTKVAITNENFIICLAV